MARKKVNKFSDEEIEDKSDEGGGNISEDDEEIEDEYDEEDDAMLDYEEEDELYNDEEEDDEEEEVGDNMDDDNIGSENETTKTTSRQRDIKRGSKIDLSLLTASSNKKKKKELTDEMKQKKSELAIQRRNKKIEEDEAMMRDVVNQLFYRKAATKEVIEEVKKPSRHDLYMKDNEGNTICYRDTIESGKTISYPIGHPMIDIIEKDINLSKSKLESLSTTTTTTTPKQIKCSVENCNKIKRYNCPKNNLPVCTMTCYNIIMNKYK